MQKTTEGWSLRVSLHKLATQKDIYCSPKHETSTFFKNNKDKGKWNTKLIKVTSRLASALHWNSVLYYKHSLNNDQKSTFLRTTKTKVRKNTKFQNQSNINACLYIFISTYLVILITAKATLLFCPPDRLDTGLMASSPLTPYWPSMFLYCSWGLPEIHRAKDWTFMWCQIKNCMKQYQGNNREQIVKLDFKQEWKYEIIPFGLILPMTNKSWSQDYLIKLKYLTP